MMQNAAKEGVSRAGGLDGMDAGKGGYLHFCLSGVDSTADFSDKASLMPESTQQSQHITGRAAGVGFQQGIPLSTETVLGQVNEQFSQGYNILFRHK